MRAKDDNTLSRRDFVASVGAGLLVGAAQRADAAAPEGSGVQPDAGTWHQRIKRIGHVNFNERDAGLVDVEAWADFLASMNAQATMLSVTGVLAFYPTSVPHFPQSPYLQGRDLFGECVRAARKRGIRVIGRMSPDMALKSIAEQRPEWFRRNADGSITESVIGPVEISTINVAPGFGLTCQFTSYNTEHIPAIMAEVLDRYDVDGIYTNGWPGVSVPRCHCAACQRIGDPESEAYRRAYEARTIELWDQYAALVAGRGRDKLFTGNLGGGLQGSETDLRRITARAPWFTADNQGRDGSMTPSWGASQQVRVARATARSSTVVNVTAAYSKPGGVVWRNVSGNAAEVTLRLAQTAAAGGTNWYHWLGFDQGFHEDRRWQQVGRDFLAWQARHDAHFHNVRSIASLGLVVAPRSNRLYKPPAGSGTLDSAEGMYAILTEGRIPFDIVHEDDLSLAAIGRYKALVLPNVALLGDEQLRQLAAYAAAGGSLLATFETGAYDETGKARGESGLAGLFDLRRTGAREGFGRRPSAEAPGFAGLTNVQRIERRHPVFAGFEDTNWIQGGNWRVPIEAAGDSLLTNIAPYPVYPTEAVYSKAPHTTDATAVLRDNGASRLAYFAGDLEATYWRSGAGDLGDLLTNAVHWLLRDDRPLVVAGDGLIESFGWETEPGHAVHLVNHTNPNFRTGMMRRVHPVGPQQVTLRLRDARRIRSARLLRADRSLAFAQRGDTVSLTVPGVADYEVVALT